MSRAALALALALLTLAPAALAGEPEGPPQVSFHVPAQAGGDLAVSAQWALLVFHGPAAVDLALPQGGEATTRSTTRAAGPAFVSHPAAPVDTHLPLSSGTAALAFTEGRWGSLFVLADRIEATSSGPARLDQVDSGRAVEPLLPWPPPPTYTLPSFPHAAVSDEVLLAAGDYGDHSVRLTASGVRRVEWYNATVRCTMACPTGPSYQAWALPPLAGHRVEVRNSTAVDAGASASLALDGVLAAGLLGGGRMDVAIDGWVRLPQVVLEGCGECGTGRTLRLDGDALGLRGLTSEGRQTDRLHGQLDAPGAWSALDEDPPMRLQDGLAGAAAGGGLAIGIALALRAFGLRARPTVGPGAAGEGFGHERRTGLFQLVAGEPGLTFREVERRLGWGNGVTRHHLDVLVAEGHLVARRHLNTVRYFENHGRFDGDWQAVVHRRDAGSRWILEVLEAGARTQREVVELAAAQGWSRSATQRKLGRLVADGLVAARPDGNGRRYSVTPPGPPAPPGRWAGWGAGLGLGSGRTGPRPAAEEPAALARPGGRAGP